METVYVAERRADDYQVWTRMSATWVTSDTQSYATDWLDTELQWENTNDTIVTLNFALLLIVLSVDVCLILLLYLMVKKRLKFGTKCY